MPPGPYEQTISKGLRQELDDLPANLREETRETDSRRWTLFLVDALFRDKQDRKLICARGLRRPRVRALPVIRVRVVRQHVTG